MLSLLQSQYHLHLARGLLSLLRRLLYCRAQSLFEARLDVWRGLLARVLLSILSLLRCCCSAMPRSKASLRSASTSGDRNGIVSGAVSSLDCCCLRRFLPISPSSTRSYVSSSILSSSLDNSTELLSTVLAVLCLLPLPFDVAAFVPPPP
jgi:hypothetical protein